MTPSLRITDKSRPQPTSYLPYVDTKFHEPTTVQEDRFLDLYKVMHVLILDLFFFKGHRKGRGSPTWIFIAYVAQDDLMDEKILLQSVV